MEQNNHESVHEVPNPKKKFIDEWSEDGIKSSLDHACRVLSNLLASSYTCPNQLKTF